MLYGLNISKAAGPGFLKLEDAVAPHLKHSYNQSQRELPDSLYTAKAASIQHRSWADGSNCHPVPFLYVVLKIMKHCVRIAISRTGIQSK